jgi:hypothetical protein
MRRVAASVLRFIGLLRFKTILSEAWRMDWAARWDNPSLEIEMSEILVRQLGDPKEIRAMR